jgi:hypothetical protein
METGSGGRLPRQRRDQSRERTQQSPGRVRSTDQATQRAEAAMPSAPARGGISSVSGQGLANVPTTTTGVPGRSRPGGEGSHMAPSNIDQLRGTRTTSSMLGLMQTTSPSADPHDASGSSAEVRRTGEASSTPKRQRTKTPGLEPGTSSRPSSPTIKSKERKIDFIVETEFLIRGKGKPLVAGTQSEIEQNVRESFNHGFPPQQPANAWHLYPFKIRDLRGQGQPFLLQ